MEKKNDDPTCNLLLNNKIDEQVTSSSQLFFRFGP